MLLLAPSKVNLFLRITGALPGGFHSIETLFLPLRNPADELEIRFVPDGRRNISVRCSHPAVPCGKKNLCWKAVSLTLDALKISDSIEVEIRKNIPVAGGMGGGSSDAAAVISAMQKHYGRLPDGGTEIAIACGSDVPFFLNPVASTGCGRGEKLTPVEGLKIPEIRIIPMYFPISAAWAYSHVSEKTKRDSRSLEDLIAALRSGDFSRAAALMRNDLAPAAFRKFPLLELAGKKFEAENPGWKVQLSGSGATLFAVRTF